MWDTLFDQVVAFVVFLVHKQSKCTKIEGESDSGGTGGRVVQKTARHALMTYLGGHITVY